MVPVIGIAMSKDEQGFRLGEDYVRAVEDAGGLAVGLPPASDVERVVAHASYLHGILIPGGNDVDPNLYGEDITPENGPIEPVRDRFELPLVRWALEQGVPILGICRGMQVLNVAAGGTLYQDIPSQTGTRLQHRQKAPRSYATHGVNVAEGSMLARALGVTSCRVNTFHHQAVREVAPGFVASAHATDGLVEAIERPGHPFALGVQWHPEAMQEEDPVQAALFARFVAAARAYMSGQGASAGDRAV